MARIIIVFASTATAAANVAGLPSVARATREAVSAVLQAPERYDIILSVVDGPFRDEWSRTETARLAPSLAWEPVIAAELLPNPGDLWLPGELLAPAGLISGALNSRLNGIGQAPFALDLDEVQRFYANEGPAGLLNLLDEASRQIVKKTVKCTDGIVSRYLNRPISTHITAILLKGKAIRPIHGTAAAAFTALVMFCCLLSGTFAGLIFGAILFHAASVIDGVDGEIARATFRTSKKGATLDSLTDAATNLAFLFGLGISLTLQGAEDAAKLGIVAVAFLGVGLLLLGGQAILAGRPITFDGLKHVVGRYRSPAANWLIWLTMRDFFALASALMVICGFGQTLLQLFAAGSCMWLLAVATLIMAGSKGAKADVEPASDFKAETAPSLRFVKSA